MKPSLPFFRKMMALSSPFLLWVGVFCFNVNGVLANETPFFSDVTRTEKNYVALQTLAEQGIVKGNPDGTFGLKQVLNRAQAVTLVLRYARHTVAEGAIASSRFKDVDKTAWYAAAVEQAADLGYVKGNPDGTFHPGEAVTSAAFLTLLARADGIDLTAFEEGGGAWYTAVMNYAQEAGIYSSSNPATLLNRDVTAGMLYLSLILREEKNNSFLQLQAQKHLTEIESSIAANQLPIALYHAQLGVDLLTQLQQNLPNDSPVAAKKFIAEGYLSWVQAIGAALEEGSSLALIKINQALALATEAYFADPSVQPLASHLKDRACETYAQLSEPKGEVPADCVQRLAQ